MCDALSRNTPRLSEGVRLLLAYCLAHGRRQFVEVAENFPDECRYVLEMLGGVWYSDELARKRNLSAEERLHFHQQHSGPLMKTLKEWMEAQLAEHKIEPNSGLGKAIQYMLRHWMPLTLFLREAGAPLDNNLATAASGSDDVMPRAGLCRAGTNGVLSFRTISNFRRFPSRHNHRLSRKASSASGARKRSGATLHGLACASAFSFSCMSACR